MKKPYKYFISAPSSIRGLRYVHTALDKYLVPVSGTRQQIQELEDELNLVIKYTIHRRSRSQPSLMRKMK